MVKEGINKEDLEYLESLQEKESDAEDYQEKHFKKMRACW